MTSSMPEPEEPIDRLVAAIDRLTAAVLASAAIKPASTVGDVIAAYKGTLDGVLNESRDLKAAFERWTKPPSN